MEGWYTKQGNKCNESVCKSISLMEEPIKEQLKLTHLILSEFTQEALGDTETQRPIRSQLHMQQLP